MKIFIVFSFHHCPHLAHGSEYGSIRLHQLLWRIQLRNNTILENQHSVIVQHSVETVGDGDNRAENTKILVFRKEYAIFVFLTSHRTLIVSLFG